MATRHHTVEISAEASVTLEDLADIAEQFVEFARKHSGRLAGFPQDAERLEVAAKTLRELVEDDS